MNKKSLSERDIITKVILPALERRGWDIQSQVREEFPLAPGRVIVKGRQEQARLRGKPKRADVVLFYKPNIPVAVIEVNDNNPTLGAGIQQALEYADLLDVPLAYSTNGDTFLESDRTGVAKQIEREVALDSFPSPDELWRRYCAHKQLREAERPIAAQDWYLDMEARPSRYYQLTAVNRAVEAIAKGEPRLLLVMATGTGKTYTAFQIIWRLWKAKVKKRVLFLADRNILIDQARNNEFQPFGHAMTTIEHRTVDKSFAIYLALYQAVSGSEEEKTIYKQFSPGFFDLVIIDECHRGSAAESSAWREILKYFASATQIGLTATPKETADVSTIDSFGEPLFTYSLKQGIEDGYLAPYKVIRIDFDKDVEGSTSGEGKRDKYGQPVKNRKYQRKELERALVLEQRTELVARKVTEYLRATERYAKTIVFCQGIEHAERMRSALARENADEYLKDRRYVRKITGEDPVGRLALNDFVLPSSRYPVIATTSKLLTTGVDVQTCKLIVIDREIGSMTELKQIIGCGTRIREDYGKMWFTIMDFRGVTRMFADPAFDGPPEQIYEPREGDLVVPPEPSGDRPGDAGEGPIATTEKATRRGGRRPKIVIDEGVVVVNENVERYGTDGKRIDASLEGHARATLRALFKSKGELRRRWVTPGEKAAIVTELEQQGVAVGELALAFGNDYATVDVLAYAGFSDPLITRRERARSARMRKVLDAHSGLTRAVLEGLLAKFVDEGVEELETIELLRVRPFDTMGTLVELVRAFGGRPTYEKAVAALEEALYGEP